ncbi:MAG: DUF599 family protein [Pseudomonadota bacterium]
MMTAFTTMDWIALSFFLFGWLIFEIINDYSPMRFKSLSSIMARRRREWMLEMAERDLRMIDTQIMQGLQNGAAYFGSACILAIGGCFALLGATDKVLEIYRDLPVAIEVPRLLFELRVFGLVTIVVYAFFKFGWAYRLFNYCSILMGAVPMCDRSDAETRKKAALESAEMNIIASRHFNAGLRGMFFALGYLGWFINPTTLICSTLFVMAVLTRRNYFSAARRIVADDI